MSEYLTVLKAGRSIVTDLGRTRGPRFGLPVNGALDQYAARVANVLVANDENAALIEITALDFSMTTGADLLLSVTGAESTFLVDGLPRPAWEPVSVRAGETVELLKMSSGLRSYLAIHGSVEAPFLLGSCAPDTVIDFGMRLADGDRVVVKETCRPVVNPFFDAELYNLHVPNPRLSEEAIIDVTDGPDRKEFGATAGRLFESSYIVGDRSNHIGLRLNGPLPQRASTTELLSRGVPVGAIEVPTGDDLLVLLRGRGVTAGYPVVAVVTTASLDRLAQVRPGDRVVFRHIDVSRAGEKLRAQRTAIDHLKRRVGTVFECLHVPQLNHIHTVNEVGAGPVSHTVHDSVSEPHGGKNAFF